MNEVTAVLRIEAMKRGVELAVEEFALLLSAACNGCCDKSLGGNGTCPPTPTVTETS